MLSVENKLEKDLSRAESNIRQLCEIVNSYDLSSGGNGRKVRVEDFLEPIEHLKKITTPKQN